MRGGAYGCGFRASERGALFYYSYRDPSPVASLSIYENAPAFIREFAARGEPVDNYIISGVAGTEPLMSPGRRGAAADRDFLAGITPDDRRRIRREMLDFNARRMEEFARLFDKLKGGFSQCIVGAASALDGLDDAWTKYSL